MLTLSKIYAVKTKRPQNGLWFEVYSLWLTYTINSSTNSIFLTKLNYHQQTFVACRIPALAGLVYALSSYSASSTPLQQNRTANLQRLVKANGIRNRKSQIKNLFAPSKPIVTVGIKHQQQ